MVERFSQQLQPPSRILHKKEPGGPGVAQVRTHSGQPYILCPLDPDPGPWSLTSLPHHCRLQPQGGQGQAGRAHTQPGTCTCREHTAVSGALPGPVPGFSRQCVSPGLWVHLDHPVPIALPVPVLIQPVG